MFTIYSFNSVQRNAQRQYYFSMCNLLPFHNHQSEKWNLNFIPENKIQRILSKLLGVELMALHLTWSKLIASWELEVYSKVNLPEKNVHFL